MGMGRSSEVGRAALRVGLSSAGEVVGRAVNLLLPFVLFAAHKADAYTDGFFLALAVALFVQASVGGGLVSALVPEFVRSDERRSMVVFAVGAAGAGLLAGVSASVVTAGTLPASVSAIAVGTMAAAGLLAAPPIALLNADHRYGVPGLCWALRLVPVALFVVAEDAGRQLAALLLGLAAADALRAVILLRMTRARLGFSRSQPQLGFPVSAASVILASVVAGFNPLVVRWIATLHDPGSVSLLEAADRLYSSVASLATIGVGSVTLVYLARLRGADGEVRRWRTILRVSIAWSMLWLVVSLALWRWFPWDGSWFVLQSPEGMKAVRDTFLCLAVGMTGFILTGVFARRLLVVGLSHWLVPLSLAGLACTLVAGLLAVPAFGVPGIGAALSLTQYLVAGLMILVLKSKGKDAHTRSG